KVAAPYRQDMPPPGGFEAVKYKRNLPFRGPGALAILGGVAAISAFGFYRYGQGALEKRELQREKAWSRIHLVPLLMAEGDRDAYRRQQAALAREKEIMKDVKGWEVSLTPQCCYVVRMKIFHLSFLSDQAGKSIYNNPKYASPQFVVL
ncbi:GRIM-19 protein-domain-containing protein, partial [Lentinula edodes]